MRACGDGETRLTVILDEETLAILKRAKELFSHSHPDASWSEVIKLMGQNFLKKNDPLQKNSKQTRNTVIKKADSRCEFVDHETGRVCGTRFQAEQDHIQPTALGGGDEPENGRCLCHKHNQLMAERSFGKEHMNRQRH
jgi:predicted restriction endonuclease